MAALHHPEPVMNRLAWSRTFPAGLISLPARILPIKRCDRSTCQRTIYPVRRLEGVAWPNGAGRDLILEKTYPSPNLMCGDVVVDTADIGIIPFKTVGKDDIEIGSSGERNTAFTMGR